MGRDKARLLNIGCGLNKIANTENCEVVNLDAYEICKPDVLWNIEEIPWPFESCSFDAVSAWHVFEHLHDWWSAFEECSRVLRVGGTLEIRVPDESTSMALTFRDHVHVFGRNSFHGADADDFRASTNAWAAEQLGKVPLKMTNYQQVPYPQYNWMMRWPIRYVLAFCAAHLRNFIWEQRFMFCKTKLGVNDDVDRNHVLSLHPLRVGREHLGHSGKARLPEMRESKNQANESVLDRKARSDYQASKNLDVG